MKKENQKNEEYIYIVLVKALTGLGNFARRFSKYEYTHIAVCMDEKLNDFITFSRKKHCSPFDSGFMHETLDCYAFGNNVGVKLKVFKVPTDPENKIMIKNFISEIEEDKEYIFNIYSMSTMMIFHGFMVYKSYNCMSFVSRILQLSGTVSMTKKYYKYDIKELDLLLSEFLYKEDYFYKTETLTADYMEKVSFLKNLCLFFKLNGKLLYRIIVKRKDIK